MEEMFDNLDTIEIGDVHFGGVEDIGGSSDVRNGLMYLCGLRLHDPTIFWRHTVDREGRLQHLFWCDGISQIDYKLFGDVLAFDTTYGKSNKYPYPLVVLSGVNHHNQTTVFASAIIANETEETYTWLLEQFMVAMEGKSPVLVITNGDIALMNAISKLFPNARHRLCALHLLRGATSNVKNPNMTEQFKKCMLCDEISKFHHMWDEMVAQFGLEDHSWARDIYKKRRMWATAYIRGICFSGFRTTSRCEGLYGNIGRFARSCLNLVDFLKNFHHCLNNLRHKELEADFKSVYGEPVLQTNLKALERSASRVFTREIFMLFRPVLEGFALMIVVRCEQKPTQSIYTVSKYLQPGKEWRVSFFPQTFQLKCSCQEMESVGIPCNHIVRVMVYLDMVEMPSCLVLNRWTKTAKEFVKGTYGEGSLVWDSLLMARHGTLLDKCRQMCNLCCRSEDDFNDTRKMVRQQNHVVNEDSKFRTWVPS